MAATLRRDQGDGLVHSGGCHGDALSHSLVAGLGDLSRVISGSQIKHRLTSGIGLDPCSSHIHNGIRHSYRSAGVVLYGKGHRLSSCCRCGFQIGKGAAGAVSVHTGCRIGQRPAHPEDHPQRNHVLLGQIVDDVLGFGVLDDALVQDLDGDILADGIDGLGEVAHDQLGNGLVEASVLREVHGHAIQGVLGGPLHIGLENGVAVCALNATQLSAHAHGGQRAGNHTTRLFHLGDDTAFSRDEIIVIWGRSGRHIVASLPRSGDDIGPPASRAIDSENHGAVHPLTNGLHDAGLNLTQDIKAGICHHCLGDGHDNSQLLGGQIDVVPGLLAGLLEASVPVDPVGHGQHVQDGDSGLPTGHVGQFSGQLHEYGLLGRVLLDGIDELLLNKRFCVLAGNHVGHNVSPFLFAVGKKCPQCLVGGVVGAGSANGSGVLVAQSGSFLGRRGFKQKGRVLAFLHGVQLFFQADHLAASKGQLIPIQQRHNGSGIAGMRSSNCFFQGKVKLLGFQLLLCLRGFILPTWIVSFQLFVGVCQLTGQSCYLALQIVHVCFGHIGTAGGVDHPVAFLPRGSGQLVICQRAAAKEIFQKFHIFTSCLQNRHEKSTVRKSHCA
nr:MAG TPA: hypothetical protein [Bacteriophage sp.]